PSSTTSRSPLPSPAPLAALISSPATSADDLYTLSLHVALPILYVTQAAGDAIRYLKNYQAPLDVVAVAGGDGTLNEVVNGLVNRPNDSFRLALIPMGTTNVLAYELGIKRKNAITTLLNGKEKLIYPSRLNGNRFLLMAGIGYD